MAGKNKSSRNGPHNQYPEVTPLVFLQTWQSSPSADAVAEALGMPKGIVHARASTYRGMGVKLKKMPRINKNKLDVNAMNEYIKQINEDLRRQGMEVDEVEGEQKDEPPLPKSRRKQIQKSVLEDLHGHGKGEKK